jgi:hypothetical protein
MSNNRIIYSIQQLAIKTDGGSVPFPVHGLQSVTSNTNFNLNPVFEISQLSPYELSEDVPDVQLTTNKVLDGYPPVYCLATMAATTPTLANRANQKCVANLAIFNEAGTSALGTAIGQCEASGLVVSSARYNFTNNGSFTEEVTLIGNDRVWKGDTRIKNTTDAAWANSLGVTGYFTGLDSPIGVGGVNRRQHLALTPVTNALGDTNGSLLDPDCTILPQEIAGINVSGVNVMTDSYRAHLDSINVSVNLNRDNLNELGKKAPYFRTPKFPVEVTTEVTITATSGDFISSTQAGILSNAAGGCASDSGNLSNRTIRIATCEGLRIYCGLKNKLASKNYTGGDTGGGQVMVSYTYRTYNDFTVMHSAESQFSTEALATLSTGFFTTGNSWLLN